MGANADRGNGKRNRRPGGGGLPPENPERAARAAGLRYVRDDGPGITRRRCGTGWSYKDPVGETIRDDEVRERIESLAIPPAWTDVWICPDPEGHIQATGRDDQGRKQYRYHPRWTEVRNATKFWRMIRFGEALPAIRRRVEEDLSRSGLPREKVLAAVVRLLETTCIRVGSEEYERKNGTYGLTTMRDRHVEFAGSEVRFEFEAKGGQTVESSVRDRRLARIVRECRDVPGYELFQYYDPDGDKRTIDSADVNAYLKEAGGGDFTAKDFRTWMGTLHAFVHLCGVGPAESEKEADANRIQAIDYVADHLRNSRSVCREFYVHPGVLDSYGEGDLCARYTEGYGAAREGLDPAEAALLDLLEDLEEEAEVGTTA